MSFRHFKRRLERSSEDEDSSEDGDHFDEDASSSKKPALSNYECVVVKGLEKPTKKHLVEDKKESNVSKTDSSSESEESSDSGNSSDNEDVIPLHRPLFLKKKTDNPQKATTIDQAQSIQSEAHYSEIKEENVMKNIDKANEVAKNYEAMKLQLDTNYSTNEELVKQCMLLNDDDEVDPEKEQCEWLKRHDERKMKHRSSQLAKQRESEKYEASRFAAVQKDKDRHTKYEVVPDREQKELCNKGQRFAEKVKNLHKNDRYKITRVKNVSFGNPENKGRDNEESEYSIL
ncbi:hypothetical protein SMKI_02G2630 [Saccharomyces mikatae IFO 1815]|uniref:Uncharacterized protein n=1 Tax=Saccharomyces mikatae IFO 1815 TaxID=226126 RepID=A0AA35IVP6_SACMI|nr:uncharacterized protein SMKI_02G2630 [Saccharomyces mikatae IFO 1815]CAI4037388.1 hypothetical protein SMKI_02G2630 [Saccharomyces mikatae IFO 1815]